MLVLCWLLVLMRPRATLSCARCPAGLTCDHVVSCGVYRWEPMLGVLAVGLYPQLRNEQVAYLCHLVRVLHNTQDYLALVALLLQVRRADEQGGRRAGRRGRQAGETQQAWEAGQEV